MVGQIVGCNCDDFGNSDEKGRNRVLHPDVSWQAPCKKVLVLPQIILQGRVAPVVDRSDQGK